MVRALLIGAALLAVVSSDSKVADAQVLRGGRNSDCGCQPSYQTPVAQFYAVEPMATRPVFYQPAFASQPIRYMQLSQYMYAQPQFPVAVPQIQYQVVQPTAQFQACPACTQCNQDPQFQMMAMPGSFIQAPVYSEIVPTLAVSQSGEVTSVGTVQPATFEAPVAAASKLNPARLPKRPPNRIRQSKTDWVSDPSSMAGTIRLYLKTRNQFCEP